MFYVYLIQSVKEGSFYIGSTSDLDKRIKQHNDGESKYTSKRGPWNLVYFEVLNTRSESLRRERFLKKQRNREFYKKLIDGYKKN
jgi:putative endonuclease